MRGLTLYDALSLAAGAREAPLGASAVVGAPSVLDLNGQAGLLDIGRDGVPRAGLRYFALLGLGIFSWTEP